MTLKERIHNTIVGGLSCIRTKPYKGTVHYDPNTGAYEDSTLYRGFPLASIGTGGFNINSNGAFQDFRINNNWMAPIQDTPGCLFALALGEGASRQSRVLRRDYPLEYRGLTPIKHTRFIGELPHCHIDFTDDWPLEVSLAAFSPLIPRNPQDSGLPIAFMTLSCKNTGTTPLPIEVLLGWENLLGRGGTGQLGIRGTVGPLPLSAGRLLYDDVSGNHQRSFDLGVLKGLAFETTQSAPEGSHRQSVLGSYHLALSLPEGVHVERVLSWDASEPAPPLLLSFAEGAPLPIDPGAGSRPAAAMVASFTLEPGQSLELPYSFVWWTPNHTTEADPLGALKALNHKGERVGHAYTRLFDSPGSLLAYGHTHRLRLGEESRRLGEHLKGTTLPGWIQRAMLGALDSITCNTIWPEGGTLFTLEGMDWPWYFGGLTGTNDQRLSSHIATAHLFPQLDKTEVEAFRRLRRGGVVPHGNGNCDMGLMTSDIPYGVPTAIPGVMDDAPWPDLTLSAILQITRLYRTTGDEAWLDESWVSLKELVAALGPMTRAGVPEGGSTYDSLTFKGTFSYTATVYIAALSALLLLAEERDPEWAAELRILKSRGEERLEECLWRGSHYRASEDKNTLFTGALAGDWLARYSGLKPVTTLERLRSHMALAHQTIIAPEIARAKEGKGWKWGSLPTMEATPQGQGKPTRIMGMAVPAYVGQIVTYHAMNCIHAGMVTEALESLDLIFGRAWRGGWPFSMDLYGNAGYVYMTHPALWALPNALTGAFHDVNKEALYLSPRSIAPGTKEVFPLYFPAFWGYLTLHPHGGGDLDITHTYPVPGGDTLSIKTLVLKGDDDVEARVELDHPFKLSPGAKLPLPDSLNKM